MPRNDTSDSLSVRQDDDPRKPLKALQQEAEQELLEAEKRASSAADHAPHERTAVNADRTPGSARATTERSDDGGDDPASAGRS